METIKIGSLNKNYEFLRFKNGVVFDIIVQEDVRIGDIISEINHNKVKYYLILDIFTEFNYFVYSVCDIYPNFTNLIFNK